MQPTVISSFRAKLGEGPFWHDGKLHYVDIVGRQFLVAEAGDSRVLATYAKMPSAVVPRRDGGFILAAEDGLHQTDANGENLTLLTHPEPDRPQNRFNDGKVAPHGSFYVGTMQRNAQEASGALYRLDPDGTCREILSGVTVSNGLAWEGETLYYIDSPRRQILRFTDDGRSPLEKPEICFELGEAFPQAVPDGMTIDTEGYLWVALWGGSAIIQVDPQRGKIVDQIAFPCPQVTSCCFGGPDFSTLYATTASVGYNEAQLAQWPEAGKVFAVETGRRGYPPVPFPG